MGAIEKNEKWIKELIDGFSRQKEQKSAHTVDRFLLGFGENCRKHSILFQQKVKKKGKGFQRRQENNYFQDLRRLLNKSC